MSTLAVVGAWALAIPMAAQGATDVKLPDPPPQTIVGGERTGPGEFDGVVAILAGQGLCTGTVVSNRLILTAGHCLAGLPDSADVTVFFGEEIDETMSVAAVDWAAHPDFCPECEEDIFDYGYVLLDIDFSVPGGFLLPLTDQREWDEAMVEGGDVTLVGYGEDPMAAGGNIGIKRKVSTEITDLSEKGFEFFAGGDQRDSCQGDSGGPAFVRVKDGRWRLAGITSRGSSPCGDGGFYGVPYAALCWVRDETDVDLLPSGCNDCECLDTEPPGKDRCSVDRRGDPTWALLLPLLAFLRRRTLR